MFPAQSHNFVDNSGSPLPGAFFPGSPNTNLSGISDIINSNEFEWSVVNVTERDGSNMVVDQSASDNKQSDPDPVDSSVQENNADVSGSDYNPIRISLKMAKEMFRAVCSTTYWATSFIFGSPHNPVISLQVMLYVSL